MSGQPAAFVQLLTSPWMRSFQTLVASAKEQLLLASPFLGKQPLKLVVDTLSVKPRHEIRVEVLTNLSVDNLLSGVLDITALRDLTAFLPGTSVTYLPGLHAKVYIADAGSAIISSGNLTTAGLVSNYEYGVFLCDPLVVRRVRDDLIGYAALGSKVSQETLEALVQATEGLRAVRQKAEKSISAQLRKEFEERTEQARLELLRARATGKTTQGIFRDTVLYLLERKGPLATPELHRFVQQLHPDLCDDSIDRVIGEVHFGKKWKHYVRNAQQALKRQRLIDTDGKCWFRIP